MSIAVELKIGTENGDTRAHALEVVRSAELELTTLLRRHGEIVRRISAIRQLMSDLATLYGESILNDELRAEMDRRIGGGHRPGFTRACRAVLMQSCRPLRAREASAEVRRRFPDLAERQKDLTASVTTVFHRFVRYSEARCFLDGNGVRVWQWVLPAESGASLRLQPERVHPPVEQLPSGESLLTAPTVPT